jgi:hypothetical protein
MGTMMFFSIKMFIRVLLFSVFLSHPAVKKNW